MDYTQKYLKYKKKYLELKKLMGGGPGDAAVKLTICNNGTLKKNGEQSTYSINSKNNGYDIKHKDGTIHLYNNTENGLLKTNKDDCQYQYFLDESCKVAMPTLTKLKEKPLEETLFKQKCETLLKQQTQNIQPPQQSFNRNNSYNSRPYIPQSYTPPTSYTETYTPSYPSSVNVYTWAGDRQISPELAFERSMRSARRNRW